MAIWGIGPVIAAAGIITLILSSLAGYSHESCQYWFLPEWLRILLGVLLIFFGVYFWLDSARLIVSKFKEGKLTTTPKRGGIKGDPKRVIIT